MKSFDNIKTRKFIEIYFGNNAINTYEILNILPIYDIWSAGKATPLPFFHLISIFTFFPDFDWALYRDRFGSFT